MGVTTHVEEACGKQLTLMGLHQLLIGGGDLLGSLHGASVGHCIVVELGHLLCQCIWLDRADYKLTTCTTQGAWHVKESSK